MTLDVERLAKALYAVRPMLYPQSWPDDDPDEIGINPREEAALIAAEYERLGGKPIVLVEDQERPLITIEPPDEPWGGY